MTDHIEAVAAHRPYGLDCKCGRPINSDQDWARHFLEVLDLTEEWRTSRDSWHRNLHGEKVPHTDSVVMASERQAKDQAELWDGSYVESRLAGPWRKEEQ